MLAFKICPENMAPGEIIRYCEDHDDPWVRAIARYAGEFLWHVPEEYRDDPDWYFEHIETQLHDLENDVAYHQEEEEVAYREKSKMEEKYNALRFEVNAREEHHQMLHLKARVQTLSDELDNKTQEYVSLRKQFEELGKEHEYLTEKHNTWTIIAT